MKWSDFDRYMRGEHLEGKRLVVTIVEITLDKVHAPSSGEEIKPVLWFQEAKSGLILSPTNRHALTELFGDEASACIGKRITLEAKPMRVAGRATLPIRISAAPSLQDVPQEAAGPRHDYRALARPWSAEIVLDYLEDAAADAAAHGRKGNGRFGAAIDLIKHECGTDERYRRWLAHVCRVESATQLEEPMRAALAAWVKPEPVKDGTSGWVPIAGWQAEMAALLDASEQAGGQ